MAEKLIGQKKQDKPKKPEPQYQVTFTINVPTILFPEEGIEYDQDDIKDEESVIRYWTQDEWLEECETAEQLISILVEYGVFTDASVKVQAVKLGG